MIDAALESAERPQAAAFDEILRLHERKVLMTAWRLLGHWEDAQDAAQEVFVRMHKYRAHLDQGRDLAPWLYRTTVNVCRDLYRRRRPDSELDDAAPDPAAGPDEQARHAEARRILHAALARLSQKERTAVVLRDLEGLTAAEVAAILGITEATVRSHLSNARLKIMKLTERFRRERA